MLDFLLNLGEKPLKCVYSIKYKDLSHDAFYIGCTVNLKKRLSYHIYNCEHPGSAHGCHKIYQSINYLGGHSNFVVDIMYIGDDILFVEKQLIRTLQPNMNTVTPGRTLAEYYQDNVESIRQNKIVWRYLKSEEIKRKDRERYQNRKAYCNRKSSEFYHNNIVEQKKKTSAKVNCLCGSEISFGYRKRHLETDLHKNNLQHFETKLKDVKKEILRL